MSGPHVTVRGRRGAEWARICGTARFPVLYLLPVRANLPGRPNAEVYMLDMGRMEAATLDRIIRHLAGKFGGTAAEVRADIEANGIPILAENCDPPDEVLS